MSKLNFENINQEDMKIQSRIVVIDAICGKGKTQWALERIVKTDEKFIYVTPYLEEVDRVITWCKEHQVQINEPKYVQDKEKNKGKLKREKEIITKSEHFKKLLLSGKNIVTTHALLDRITLEMLDIIKEHNYTLYLDEVHEVIKSYSFSKEDLKLLMDAKCIEVDPTTKQVHWIDTSYLDSKNVFIEFKNLCDLGAMYYYADNLYMWCFPISLFDVVDKTIILTYLFEGQLQAFYYNMYKIKYVYRSVEYDKANKCYKVIPFTKENIINDIKEYAQYIDLYEGNMNFIINENSLTTSWYNKAYIEDKTKNMGNLKRLQKHLLNWFCNIRKSKSEDNLWTTLKEYKNELKGKGYTTSFLELNSRATNYYNDRHNLAYMYNRHLRPFEKQFLQLKGVTVYEDLFALSELLQWIFRSAIREKETIYLYLPALRMRNLLKDWINLATKYIPEYDKEKEGEFIYYNHLLKL